LLHHVRGRDRGVAWRRQPQPCLKAPSHVHTSPNPIGFYHRQPHSPTLTCIFLGVGDSGCDPPLVGARVVALERAGVPGAVDIGRTGEPGHVCCHPALVIEACHHEVLELQFLNGQPTLQPARQIARRVLAALLPRGRRCLGQHRTLLTDSQPPAGRPDQRDGQREREPDGQLPPSPGTSQGAGCGSASADGRPVWSATSLVSVL
jgi:hypothetical protein